MRPGEKSDWDAYERLLHEIEMWCDVTCLTTRHIPGMEGAPHDFARWRRRARSDRYDYRTVLPKEIVFDIGDDGDWERCRGATIALWGRLERYGIPHWRTLSGGKGTHTHVFLDDPEYREPFAAWATLPRFPGDIRIVHDPRLIEPNAGTRMVREFGSGKNGRKKVMWHQDYSSLPPTREKAYSMVGHLPFPQQWESAGCPPGATHQEVRNALGGRCPKRALCLDSFPCQDCPVNR